MLQHMEFEWMAQALLSESSHCASSQSPDDIFPSLAIPTGHIITFNNTEMKAHKSIDKNRGYLCTGAFISLCCVSSWINIWHTIDTYPMRQMMEEQGSTRTPVWRCAVAISGIWCSLNHTPHKSFCALLTSWRVRPHLTFQRRTRSSSVTGPKEGGLRGRVWSGTLFDHCLFIITKYPVS